MRHDQDNDIHIGIIAGTGLGERLAAEGLLEAAQPQVIDTPFGPTSDPILTGSVAGKRVSILARHGQGHLLNPRSVPYRANIFALKSLGVTHLVASGATGSLREDIHPGEVVIVDQFIDKTENRPRTFFERAAVHVEFAEPCCPVMRRWLTRAASSAGIGFHDRGTYICMEGPAFSTRAESRMHRQWGGDLIGMTALPEARLAREAEMAYALIALPTDYDCWRQQESGESVGAPAANKSLLRQIIGNLNRATEASLALLRQALTDTSFLAAHPSAAHSALALAIWSEKNRIPPGEVSRLAPLWGRYFDESSDEGQVR